MSHNKNLNKATAAGLLIALGIVFGDIGTSPLYVFNAICNGRVITEKLILGALSCIIWTLTLQTTLKYVVLTLRADNRGEGGIFSLFALVRRHKRWVVYPAMIGGACILADGMITPPISVISALEGLKNVQSIGRYMTETTVLSIGLGIITLLFLSQQFGTATIGKTFGPIMTAWFGMLGVLGVLHLSDDWAILRALNPVHAIDFVMNYPYGFWLLGSVFLCTTGAEALYSDMGHAGRGNIRISWIFVKATIILNYLGQGAWLLHTHTGKMWSSEGVNPFYALMSHGFLPFGVALATAGAIIASQAMITGSFTLISEAIKLNLWPKMKIVYPTVARGQTFIPGINFLLFAGCVAITLFFRKSSNMDAAYGLAIIATFIMTSILFANYLYTRRVSLLFILGYLGLYLTIEVSFLIANLIKFPHGGYVTMMIAGLIFLAMFTWFKARRIKNRYVEFVRLEDYVPIIQELSNDRTIPKYATHLVYLTSANNPLEIEHKVIFSILYRKPKRADIYWFVHVDVLDDPYTMEYSVNTIIPNEVVRVEFRLGFRVDHRVPMMFRKVVEEMVKNKEVNIVSRYESLSRNNVMGDFRFIVLEKFLSRDNELPLWERMLMRGYFILKRFSLSEERGFGLDSSDVTVEKYPIIVSTPAEYKLKRIMA